MRDIEENEIFLSNTPNQHLLIWGQSGQGKTYFCCRYMEKMLQERKKILLLDYSGSYTVEELWNSKFKYMDLINNFSLFEKPFYWLAKYSDMKILQEDLKDILIDILGISSYYQKKLLRLAMQRYFNKFNSWNIPRFLKVVEELRDTMFFEESTQDDIKNLERILSRLSPFDSLTGFYVGIQPKKRHQKELPITLLQISQLPEQQKKFVTMLLSGLVWKETQRQKTEKRFDLLVFDEFQHLSVMPESSLSQILREGRRYGISAVLSSQFISCYSCEEISTLMQAGNILIFKPAENDLKFSAKMIAPQDVRTWQKILSDLNVGQAVLKGNYQLRPEGKILHTPIVCEIS